MPARMPRRLPVLLCLVAVGAGAAACGEADVEQGVEEPAREGLALELEGIEYNVFITRELNPRVAPDDAYVEADTEPGKDETLYGVFLQACNRSVAVYDFTRESANVTRVELTTFSEPATRIDRFKEIGAAGWTRRKTRKSLDRLRMVFEEPDRVELKRATIAGYEPEKAARFGAAPGMDPARPPRL